ncbi:MAG: hypothetical protein A3G57_01375 [Candidatus Andersenbacteria bacterium RIFCSPLOWO2_12_FULL_45_8]|nr:MAG: hypothetical protein A3G57_01375 [Candidatus Andersenbacteria bacterium RIFCSPLOWO2_12_FULL_45_8]
MWARNWSIATILKSVQHGGNGAGNMRSTNNTDSASLLPEMDQVYSARKLMRLDTDEANNQFDFNPATAIPKAANTPDPIKPGYGEFLPIDAVFKGFYSNLVALESTPNERLVSQHGYGTEASSGDDSFKITVDKALIVIFRRSYQQHSNAALRFFIHGLLQLSELIDEEQKSLQATSLLKIVNKCQKLGNWSS